MAVYWMTFRIHNDATYANRYEALIESVKELATKLWADTTSFIIFESENTINDIAKKFAVAINAETDLIVLGMPEFKSARLVGSTQDEDIFDLMPFIKYA